MSKFDSGKSGKFAKDSAIKGIRKVIQDLPFKNASSCGVTAEFYVAIQKHNFILT